MKPSIYRKAAKIVANATDGFEFSCHAIYKALHGDIPDQFPINHSDLEEYKDIFEPTKKELGHNGNVWYYSSEYSREEADTIRILNLLFMSEIVKPKRKKAKRGNRK